MPIICLVIVSCLSWSGEARPRLKVSDPFLPPHDALPYQYRGIALWQIEAFVWNFAIGEGKTGLTKVCSTFNIQNHAKINLPKDDPDHVYACNFTFPRAYDLVDHLIIPLTDPERHEEAIQNLPEGVNLSIPKPTRNISMAELLNPKGFPDGPDIFMTWSWEAPVIELVTSLRQHAEAVYLDLGRTRPEDVVFWICAFVLNEHQVDDELNWDLSMAPFRLGLSYAKSAIMLLNDINYGRVLTAWNYYEIMVCYILSKRLAPIGSGVWTGGAKEIADGIWGDPSAEHKVKYLTEFNISLGVPDYRTGATDEDLKMIMGLIETTQIGVDGLTNRIRSMIATALSYYSLQKVVDAKDLLSQHAVHNYLAPSWDSLELSRLFGAASKFMSLLAKPHYTPMCSADVPLGVSMHLFDGQEVSRKRHLLHQTEVTIQCPNGDNSVFISSCQCSPPSPGDAESACLWSTPRPRGVKQSCWPEHETGKLDCLDQTPLPPVQPGYCGDGCSGQDIGDLLCSSWSILVG